MAQATGTIDSVARSATWDKIFAPRCPLAFNARAVTRSRPQALSCLTARMPFETWLIQVSHEYGDSAAGSTGRKECQSCIALSGQTSPRPRNSSKKKASHSFAICCLSVSTSPFAVFITVSARAQARENLPDSCLTKRHTCDESPSADSAAIARERALIHSMLSSLQDKEAPFVASFSSNFNSARFVSGLAPAVLKNSLLNTACCLHNFQVLAENHGARGAAFSLGQ